MRIVDLNGNQNMSNSAVIKISANCPNLEELDLGWCYQVKNTGVSSILEKCPNLRKFVLCGLKDLN